jgi:hypothetical protein
MTFGNSNPKQPDRVFFEDQGAHFIFDSNFLEIGQPSIRCDQGEIGPEQHLLFQERIRILNQHRRKVFRRPAGEVDIHLRLMQAHRDRFILPRKRRVRHDDRHIGKVDGHIIDIHRIAVLQPDAAPARHTRADTAVPGVENDRQPRLGYHFVERVSHLVIGEKLL